MQRSFCPSLSTLAILALLCALALDQTCPASAQTDSSQPGAQARAVGLTGQVAHPRTSGVLFVENVGQWEAGARFQVWGGPAIQTWLSEGAIWLTVVEPAPIDAAHPRLARERSRSEPAGRPLKAAAVKLSFAGANPDPILEPFDRLDTAVSYFIGSDRTRWHPEVPVWGGVRYIDLYPGIDLIVGSDGGRWRWALDMHGLRPDLSGVRLQVEGASTVSEAGDGLLIATEAGDLALALPSLKSAADVAPGGRPTARPVACPGILGGGSHPVYEISAPFSDGKPAEPRPPSENPLSGLAFSTYVGGPGEDWGWALALDAAGRAVVAGYTASPDFPTTPGVFDPSFGGVHDAFVLRLTPDGGFLVSSTFIGGADKDWAGALGLDAAGNAVVVGETASTDFPTTAGAYDPTYNGGSSDAFVLKLSQDGSTLLYSTFVGGEDCWEDAIAVALDASGTATVTGDTCSSDFPTTPGAYDRTYDDRSDLFVLRLSTSGDSLLCSTFVGGGSWDFSEQLTLDSGDAIVAGTTFSADFPTTPGGYDRMLDGSTDLFLLKLSADCGTLLYSTYLGGSLWEGTGGVALDAVGNAVLVGYTVSTDFPTTPGAYDTHRDPEDDGFLLRLAADGASLLASTYLTKADSARGLSLDDAGNPAVAGDTYSPDFPTTPDAYDRTYHGRADGYVLKLDAAFSSLLYGTFLGGSDLDYPYALWLSSSGKATLVGTTTSDDFPVTPGAYDPTFNGSYDLFVAGLALPAPTCRLYLPAVLRER